MMNAMITYQWEIFITLEVLSIVFLFTFLIMRYAFTKQKLSIWFFGLFVLCIVLEALLSLVVYQKTGEISTFQVVIALFVIYTCTFGISDFKKLDRYIKEKVGKWRGVNLLSDAEVIKMEQAKDPKVIAFRNRRWWYLHALIFIIGHYLFWLYYGDHDHDLIHYLEDVSWWVDEDITNSAFRNVAVQQISKVWTVIFAIDTIVSWSYTFFPSKKKA